MRSRLDAPESWLAIHGFLVAFLWEMFQMPFFDASDLSTWQVTANCGLASFGDAGIMVTAYVIASWCMGDRHWLSKPSSRSVLVYLATGQAITIGIEIVAVRVSWGWSYSNLMPMALGVGLVPVVMWVLVPLLSLGLAMRSIRRE